MWVITLLIIERKNNVGIGHLEYASQELHVTDNSINPRDSFFGALSLSWEPSESNHSTSFP